MTIKWIGVALMIVSAFIGVLAYHSVQTLVGCVIFFAIGLILFSKS